MHSKKSRRHRGFIFSERGNHPIGSFERRDDGLYEVRLGQTVVGVVADRKAAEELIAKAAASTQTNMTG